MMIAPARELYIPQKGDVVRVKEEHTFVGVHFVVEGKNDVGMLWGAVIGEEGEETDSTLLISMDYVEVVLRPRKKN